MSTTTLEPSTLATKIESKIDKTVSATTGLTNTGAMAFSSVAQIMEFAKVMAIAGVAVPKHLRENAGACLAVAIQASEWQMSPFSVASKTYVVNDRLAFEAQLVNAVILKRAPIVGRFKISYSGEGQGRRCKVSATLTDGDVVDYESPTLATIPVKNSPLWKGDPDQQLFYYSSRAMCRRHFPDVLLGIYTPEEMDEAIDVTATVREVPQAQLPQRPFLPPEFPTVTNEPETASAGTVVSDSDARTEGAGVTVPAAPDPSQPQQGKTPAKRASARPKPDPVPESPASSSGLAQQLRDRVKAEGVDVDKFNAELLRNMWPALDEITDGEAAEALAVWGQLIGGAQP